MSSIPEPRWLSAEELRAWRSLQLMQMRLVAQLSRQLAADSTLSYPDYLVLVALTDAPKGRLRLGELGRELGWEQSRTSHQVRRMAERGLVTRQRHEGDARGSWVVVTTAGRSQIAAAAPGHVEAVRRLFLDRLSPAQVTAVADVAESVLAALRAEDPQRG